MLGFVLAEILIALYVFWIEQPDAGTVGHGARDLLGVRRDGHRRLVFPFSKRAKGIWESSPYRRWNLFGVPLVTIGAVVNLAYLVILAVFFFFQSADKTLEGLHLRHRACSSWPPGSLGIAWYFFWSWRAKRTAGIDTQHAHRRVAA